MEHLSQDIELVFNNRDRLLDAFKLIALKVGVFLEGEIHVFLNADVVHDQALVLAGIDAVDAGNLSFPAFHIAQAHHLYFAS